MHVLFKCAQIIAELQIILNLLLQQPLYETVFTWKTNILWQGFNDNKYNAYVVIIWKAADEVRITTSFKPFGSKKIHGLVVTSKKLINYFAAWLQESRAGCGQLAASWKTMI
jgi:hypothetical protein